MTRLKKKKMLCKFYNSDRIIIAFWCDVFKKWHDDRYYYLEDQLHPLDTKLTRALYGNEAFNISKS